MGIGAVFILLVVVIVVAVLVVLLFGTSGALRRAKMHPEGDKIEAPQEDGMASRDGSDAEPRPSHVRVSGEQRTRFIPDH